MDEAKFWAVIDQAWKSNDKLASFHESAMATLESDAAKESLDESCEEPFIPHEEQLLAAIREQLDQLPAEELLEFDRILERKLYAIDRADVHAHTDGSDDGFLYCRGFIVVMGQAYYEAVDKTPSKAMYDWECEAFTYLPLFHYEDKFGKAPASDICRETGSNSEQW